MKWNDDLFNLLSDFYNEMFYTPPQSCIFQFALYLESLLLPWNVLTHMPTRHQFFVTRIYENAPIGHWNYFAIISLLEDIYLWPHAHLEILIPPPPLSHWIGCFTWALIHSVTKVWTPPPACVTSFMNSP